MESLKTFHKRLSSLHSRISVTEFCCELCVLRMRELIPEARSSYTSKKQKELK